MLDMGSDLLNYVDGPLVEHLDAGRARGQVTLILGDHGPSYGPEAISQAGRYATKPSAWRRHNMNGGRHR